MCVEECGGVMCGEQPESFGAGGGGLVRRDMV